MLGCDRAWFQPLISRKVKEIAIEQAKTKNVNK
jgi:hypothetical protein